MRFSRFSTVLLPTSGWIALAATALPAQSPVRVVVAVAFLMVCPGAAVVVVADALMVRRGGRPYDRLAAAAIAVAVSLALGTLVSEAFALTGTFTVARCVIALATLTTGLALGPTVARLGVFGEARS
jgi:hypothetical protein